MLDIIRSNAQSWVLRIALVAIAFSMAFFLGGGGMLGQTPGIVVTVGDIDVMQNEYMLARQRNEAFLREQYGDQLTPDLLKAMDIPSMTMRQVVDRALLRHEATRLELEIPDDTVRRAIQQVEAFQRNGAFSPSLYRDLLRAQGMSPALFEDSMRNDLLATQLTDLVKQGVRVSEEEAWEAYRRGASEVVLSYLEVKGADFEAGVVVDEDALATFFETGAEKYRRPDTVKVRYLAYTPEAFVAKAQASDEEIEEYYELNKGAEFTTEERVSARHILKRVAADADDETRKAAREAIDAIAARLQAGEDFAEVAKAESEDPGSAVKGGDLGVFGRGRMVKPFEEAAFSMEPGNTSDVIETSFGYHIIKVEEKLPGGVESLDEVRDEIVAKLARRTAVDIAFDSSAEDAAALADGTSFAMIAEERGLEIHDTPLIGDGDVVPGIGLAPAVTAAALELASPGDTSEPVKVGEAYYILELAERKASYIPELAEVREQVVADFKVEQAAEAARERAEEIFAAAQAGKSLADLADEYDLDLTDTEAFGPSGQFIPGLGAVAGLKEMAFRTESDGELLPRTFSHRGNTYVLARKSMTEPDRDGFAEAKDQVMEQLAVSKEQRVLDAFLEDLRANTEIAYNRAVVEPLLGSTGLQ
jgi:peptidyl-prolyl cis-trans isomerase D